MVKNFWMKHLDDESNDKQPSCMWGLVHVLGYHRWQSNVRRMIHYPKYGGVRHDKCNGSPDTIYNNDAYESEMLLSEEHSPQISTKRFHATKKRSLRARIKALISEEISRENEKTRSRKGTSVRPNLQRTYSMHHVESFEDGFGKILTDWKHPIFFIPKDVENGPSPTKAAGDLDDRRGESDLQSPKEAAQDEYKEDPDVFEIFKLDKQLLLKRLQDSDENIASFSRSAFGLNSKARFGKSRSFPAQTVKLKPLKLESKQKEVWSLPRESKSQSVNQTQSFEEVTNREAENATERIREKNDKDGIRKRARHHRSSSLNDSLERYARLFENSFRKDSKLSSKSLKLSNEYGLAPMYFRRIRSLSNADSYCSDLNFEVFVDNDTSGNGSVVIAKHSSSGLQNSEEANAVSLLESDEENATLNAKPQIREDYESLRLHTRGSDCLKVDGFKEEADKLKQNDSIFEDTDCSDIIDEVHNDQSFILDSDIRLQESETHLVETQISKAANLENDEITDTITNSKPDGCPEKKETGLDYVWHILEQSGIAVDSYEMTWHSSDQPLAPQLFEEVEARWPHEQDELDGWPDFHGCWHHQMLFDLINEVLAEVYDTSLPYYPKALSSNCHVRLFPTGNCIIEDVCSSIGTFLDTKPEEKQSLEWILARDLARDRSWMNLQMESESIALYLEDMIFSELVEEVVCS